MKIEIGILLTVSCLVFGGMAGRDAVESEAAVRTACFLPAPCEDAVTFVRDEGDDLMQGKTNLMPPIVVDLPISRYFGTAAEVRRQVEVGLMPKMVQLYMPIYDVDCEPLGPEFDHKEEYDYIYLNGKYIGRADGYDDKWMLNHFEVPISYLNFPTAPGRIAHNEIKVVVDAENTRSYWSTELGWVAVSLYAPLPLLLIHGVLSSDATWTEFQRALSRNYGIPSYAVNLSGRKSIESNGVLLKKILEEDANAGKFSMFGKKVGLCKLFGVDAFNVIGHSKGGLDARFYASKNGLNGNRVNTLMQVSSPNGGSRFADYLAGRLEDEFFLKVNNDEAMSGDYYDANLARYGDFLGCVDVTALGSLTCATMARFNTNHPKESSNAPIHTVTGRVEKHNGIYAFCNEIIPRLAYGHDNDSSSSCHWGDGIVSVASAHAIDSAEAESPICSDLAGHSSIITALASLVQEIFEPNFAICQFPAEDTEPYLREFVRSETKADYLPETGQLANAKSLLLQEGEMAQVEFENPRPGNIAIFMASVPQSSRITVIAPDGESWNSISDAAAFQYMNLGEILTGATDFSVRHEETSEGELDGALFELKDADAGTFKVAIEPNALPCPITSTVVFMTESKDPPQISMKAELNPLIASGNDPLKLLCWFDDGGNVANVDNVENPEFKVNVYFCPSRGNRYKKIDACLTLNDDGTGGDEVAYDGVFSADFYGTANGTYKFDVNGSAVVSGQAGTYRQIVMGDYAKNGSRIIDVGDFVYLDANGNQLIDGIELPLKVSVEPGKKYRISGTLNRNGEKWYCSDASVEFLGMLGKPTCDVVLKFPCNGFYDSGYDESYFVGQLSLVEIDNDGWPHLLQNYGESIWTDAKNHQEYEHVGIFWNGNGDDYLKDVDGDGVMDRLCVDLEVCVDSSAIGNYECTVFLSSENCIGSYCKASTRVEFNTEQTTQILHFEFPRSQILATGYSGHFLVRGISCHKENGKVFRLPGIYRTKYYGQAEFLEDVNMLDVTDKTLIRISDQQLNRNDGSLLLDVVLTNQGGKTEAPLQLVFWIALPRDENFYLKSPDGTLDNGYEYADLSEAVMDALLKTGNRDQKMDDGESVTVQVEVFARLRSVPDAKILAFWADPPILKTGAQTLKHRCDLNSDYVIDDGEMLFALRDWKAGSLLDYAFVQAVDFWRAGQYCYDGIRGMLVPN